MTAVGQEPQDWRKEQHYRLVKCCRTCQFAIYEGRWHCVHEGRTAFDPVIDCAVCDQYKAKELT